SRTCATVAATSAVSVFVIDCTTIGAPPPIPMPPTLTWRVRGRSMDAAGFIGPPRRASFQPQSRDVLLCKRCQVDRLAFVAQRDVACVSDRQRERRWAGDGLRRAGLVIPGEQQTSVAVAYLGP